MTSKHTPGPWAVGGPHGLLVNSPAGTIVVHPGGSAGAGREELCANARLIAAAPDLLEVASRLLSWADSYARMIETSGRPADGPAQDCLDARAIIAQAKGE